jgi:hypothetical protein
MQASFTDSVNIAGATRITKDGFLVASARVARVGVQEYSGASIGKPDMGMVRVYRSEKEVFDTAAMASLAHRPITLDHPDDFVTAGNWKSLAVGDTGGKVVRDGDHISLDLALMDQAAIDAVRTGKRQLSVGYSCILEFIPGIATDGQSYDAIQREIRANHIAIVDAARAGPACRIGDAAAFTDGWSDAVFASSGIPMRDAEEKPKLSTEEIVKHTLDSPSFSSGSWDRDLRARQSDMGNLR